MCRQSQLPAFCWLSLLLPQWAASQAIATGFAWSAAITRSTCRPPSSPLLKMHVRTLRLNRSAGRPPHCKPSAPRLWLVKPASEAC